MLLLAAVVIAIYLVTQLQILSAHVDHTEDGPQPVKASPSSNTPCPTAGSVQESSPAYTMVINVFTYNRLEGLIRLLLSLERSDYLGRHDIALAVFIDFTKTPDKATPQERTNVLQFVDGNLSSLWSHGPIRVHRRDVNVGLKKSIMEAWYPIRDDEVAAFFEDDIEVSPHWFRWIDMAVRFHGPSRTNRDGPNSKLLGVSLFRPILDELSGRDIRIDNNFEPFVLQQPCSWGAVYFSRPWRRFRNWYEEHRRDEPVLDDPNDPSINPSSNTWDSKSSWKKYLIKLMYLQGWFMIYPNFPASENLSKNHLMAGEHPLPPKKKFKLPLVSQSLSAEAKRAMGHMPPLEEMWAFDVMFKKVGNFAQLPNYRSVP